MRVLSAGERTSRPPRVSINVGTCPHVSPCAPRRAFDLHRAAGHRAYDIGENRRSTYKIVAHGSGGALPPFPTPNRLALSSSIIRLIQQAKDWAGSDFFTRATSWWRWQGPAA
jgi:hypothetical protein